ncbi:hypothetical protein C8R44DRAFT_363418 [Mycena epipterygia]|nr:hypothetical protein C8R44DRAFT_363418 [Mycena epipterygia]
MALSSCAPSSVEGEGAKNHGSEDLEFMRWVRHPHALAHRELSLRFRCLARPCTLLRRPRGPHVAGGQRRSALSMTCSHRFHPTPTVSSDAATRRRTASRGKVILRDTLDATQVREAAARTNAMRRPSSQTKLHLPRRRHAGNLVTPAARCGESHVRRSKISPTSVRFRTLPVTRAFSRTKTATGISSVIRRDNTYILDFEMIRTLPAEQVKDIIRDAPGPSRAPIFFVGPTLGPRARHAGCHPIATAGGEATRRPSSSPQRENRP